MIDTADFSGLRTPCYVIDEAALKKNLQILHSLKQQTGCKILLAQKAFSMFSMYPLLRSFLDGTTASSLYEARLGYEEFGGETHIFSPAYKDSEFEEILTYCNHLVFNMPSQWHRFKQKVKASAHSHSCGLRINPEYSEIDTPLYDPCQPDSRLGTRLCDFDTSIMKELNGLHFHTLCEQNSDVLKRTLQVVEEKFGSFLYNLDWVNFGGGHHITRDDYDIPVLIDCIVRFSQKYDLTVYLEPGEAVALNAGYLVTEVLDVAGKNVILDTSFACHMPDVLEMPYRPEIIGAGLSGEKEFTYRFGGPTCLSGDVSEEYSFAHPLKKGERLVFCDMAIYTMVKNNTFNGIRLPDIVLRKEDGSFQTIRSFGYEDFKARL